jgi:hypothetical protein
MVQLTEFTLNPKDDVTMATSAMSRRSVCVAKGCDANMGVVGRGRARRHLRT